MCIRDSRRLPVHAALDLCRGRCGRLSRRRASRPAQGHGTRVLEQRAVRLLVTVRPAGRVTSLLEVPNGSLELITTGSGLPATVFAHGVDGSIQTTRPFGSGVKGSRTFLHFRGYGASSDPGRPLTYAALEDDLRAVADHVGATQAIGVSVGVGAMCALLAHTPLRFDRLVFP